MGSPPSCERPRRVPLSRQPPIWFMISVVVAALVPLMMQMGHHPVGPAHARAEIPTMHSDPTSIRVVEVPAAEPAPPTIEAATGEQIVLLDTSGTDADEAEETDELGLCPAPCDGEHDAAIPREAAPDRPHRSSRPALLTRATAACKDGDKKTARSTYRALPLGDSRRKEIRKACRREGVWIL